MAPRAAGGLAARGSLLSGVSHVALIANPASGRGRAARLIPRARAAFAREGITDFRLTTHAGDEARVVGEALQDGVHTIAVLGGDGTWGKCAAALAESGADARIAFLRGGTGNDFAKNFPAPSGDYAAMARLCAGPSVEWRVDMGRLEGDGHTDLFLNVAGFGFDVAVLEDSLRGGNLTGNAVYVVAALRTILSYPGLDVCVDAPGERSRTAMMLVVSNGRNFGGAFRIAPNARVDDGALDLVEVGDVRGLSRVPLLLRALWGAHLSHPAVTTRQAAAFTLRFAGPPSWEGDGDLRRARSDEVRVSCVRGALRVIAGAR